MTGTMTDPTQDELVRSRQDRVVAGVAGGLALKFGIGVGWIRVAFVVMLAFGGVGALAYGIGWLIIREEGQTESMLDQWLGDLDNSATWLGAGLVAIAAMVLLGATDLVRGDMVFAAALFLFGLLLYRGKLPTRPTGGDRGDASIPDPLGGTPTDTPGEDPTGGAAVGVEASPDVSTSVWAGTERPDASDSLDSPGVPDGPGPTPVEILPEPTPPEPRTSSLLGRLTFAVMLVTLGVMAVFDNLDVVVVDLRHYVAAAVVVTGAGLLVGTFVGRARGLIALGLVLLPLLMFSAAVHIDVFGEYGDRRIIPQTTAELDSAYELSGGRLVFDLSELDLTDADGDEAVTVEATVGMGEILVVVPADVPIIVDTRVGIGRLDLVGDVVSDRNGFDLTQRIDTTGDAEPVLVLDLEVGIGNLELATS